jgi:hypothetical protein
MGKTLRSVVSAIGLWTCAAMCAPLTAYAQRLDEVGVRAQGMAGAFVAVANDATATWWNPAGLANGLSFADLTAEIDQHGGRAVAVGFPSLGVSYYHRNISQIQPTNSTEQGGSGRQDLGAVGSGLPASESVGVDQMGVTVGQSFGGHFVIGSTLKLDRAKSNTRGDHDIGAMATLGVVRLGIVMRDVSEPSFGSGADTLVLPRRGRAGAAVLTPVQGMLQQLTLAVDADLTTAAVDGRDERDVSAGAEAWMRGGRIGVRGGVGKNTVGAGGAFGAFGLSVAPYSGVFVEGYVTRGESGTRDRWGIDLRLAF